MKKKGFSAEQIVGKLREAEVLLGQGSTVDEVGRKPRFTEQTYHQWKREYGVTVNVRVYEVSPKRLGISFFGAAWMQQKEKDLQIVFCNSLISLVSGAGIEPATY
jgi:hypothetical protein